MHPLDPVATLEDRLVTMRPARWASRVLPLCAIRLLLAGTVTVVCLAACGSGSPSDDQDASDALVTSNATPDATLEGPYWSLQSEVTERRSFNFCVDTYGLAASSGSDRLREQGRDALGEAIEGLRAHSFWGLPSLESALPATYVEGCPEPPFPSTTEEEWVNGDIYGGVGQKYAKETMSNYFFHVFVMPLEQIDALLGGTTTRVVGQEFQCVGHVCGPENFAIYLTPEEVTNDVAAVRSVMEQAVGFK